MDIDRISNILIIIFCFVVGISESVNFPYLQDNLGSVAYSLGGFKLANQMYDKSLQREVKQMVETYKPTFDIEHD